MRRYERTWLFFKKLAGWSWKLHGFTQQLSEFLSDLDSAYFDKMIHVPGQELPPPRQKRVVIIRPYGPSGCQVTSRGQTWTLAWEAYVGDDPPARIALPVYGVDDARIELERDSCVQNNDHAEVWRYNAPFGRVEDLPALGPVLIHV